MIMHNDNIAEMKVGYMAEDMNKPENSCFKPAFDTCNVVTVTVDATKYGAPKGTKNEVMKVYIITPKAIQND
jgi:hypothetical protein